MSWQILSDISNVSHVNRPLCNALEEFDHKELIRRYRFDKGGIKFITDLVCNDLPEIKNNRNRPIPHEILVMMALRYLATNAHQQVIADTFKCSQ